MAILSYTKHFCFIHIPKTAGKSIGTTLGGYGEPTASSTYNRMLACVGIRVNHYGPYRTRRFRVHATANTIRRNLPPGVFDRLWSFSFVRNPWDMLVSQYEFIRQSPGNKRHRQIAPLMFQEFVKIWLSKKGCQGRQKRFVVDESGRCIVDFIGRYESLSVDFQVIARRIGITAELPQVGHSSRRDYRHYYSDDLAAFVAAELAEDIAFFGYSFDALPAQKNPMKRAA